MNTCAEYIGYPVPALLYDAESGNTHSRLMIFDYFATLTERGGKVPDDIARFIAKQLRLVIDGEQSPKKMFNPEGKKSRAFNPLVNDMVGLNMVSGVNKFADIGQHVYGSKNRAKAVEKQYYAHQQYSGRLARIQALLDDRASLSPHPRWAEITAELRELTTATT